MVRVLIIDGSDRGGILVYTRRLLAALQEQEVDVHYVTGVDASAGLMPYPHAPWGDEMTGMSPARRKASRLISTVKRGVSLVRYMRACRPDLVHLQTSLAFRADSLLAYLIGPWAKLVITVHNADPHSGTDREFAIEARRWNTADAIIVHSQTALEAVRPAVSPECAIAVIPVDQLVEPTGITQSDARRSLGLGANRIVLLIGIVRSYKGLKFLRELWPLIQAEDPSTELHIVGHVAEQSEDLDRLVDMEGVTMHDAWLPEDEFNSWAAAADVCVLPYESGVHSGVLHRVVANGTHIVVSPALDEEALRYSGIPVVELDPAAWVTTIAACVDREVPKPPEEATMGHETVQFYERICEGSDAR